MSNQEIPIEDLNVEEQLSPSEDNSVRVDFNLEVNRNQSADNSINTDAIEHQSEIQRRSARA